MACKCAGFLWELGALGRGTESTLDGPWPFNPGNRDDVYSTRPAALQHGRAAFDGGACCKHVVDQQNALAGNPVPPAFVQLECASQIALAASRAEPGLAARRSGAVEQIWRIGNIL